LSYKIAAATDDRMKYVIVCPADRAYLAAGTAVTAANDILSNTAKVSLAVNKFVVPFYIGKKTTGLVSVLNYIWTKGNGNPVAVVVESVDTYSMG
jgi:hypothetical protein